jgi:hypothetical protein
METIKLNFNNIDGLYSKYDGCIKNINITINVNIENELNIKNKKRFNYYEMMKAANFFINNNPNEFSYISIVNPFNNGNDNIYWTMIQDDIFLSYKITIELVLYKNCTVFRYSKHYKIINYSDDNLVDFL